MSEERNIRREIYLKGFRVGRIFMGNADHNVRIQAMTTVGILGSFPEFRQGMTHAADAHKLDKYADSDWIQKHGRDGRWFYGKLTAGARWINKFHPLGRAA
jgi:hypothetical protein